MAAFNVLLSSVFFVLSLLRFVEASVVPLTELNFDKTLQSPHFVMFFGGWCEHCKNLMPTWESLSSEYKKKNKHISIAKVDCVAETPLCAKQNIKAYPSLRLYYNGVIKRYHGKRSVADLMKFANKVVFKETSATGSTDSVIVNNVHVLTANNFDEKVALGLHFVKFYAPWCIHCVRLAPVWEKLASQHRGSTGITISKIDCTTEKSKCTQLNVNAFPTLKLFQDGQEVDHYTGSRGLHELESYVTSKISDYSTSPPTTPLPPPSLATEPPPAADSTVKDPDHLIKPYQLHENNFDSMVSFGTTFVKFYAPWCVHCKNLAPIWEQLANKCADTAGGPKIAKVDCTAEEKLCQSFGVNGYPTLMLFKEGSQKQEYTGKRDLESLYKFVVANHDKDEL